MILIRLLEKNFGEADIILQKLHKSFQLANLSSNICDKIFMNFSDPMWHSNLNPKNDILNCGLQRVHLEFLSELLLRCFQLSSDALIFIMVTADMKIPVLSVLAF